MRFRIFTFFKYLKEEEEKKKNLFNRNFKKRDFFSFKKRKKLHPEVGHSGTNQLQSYVKMVFNTYHFSEIVNIDYKIITCTYLGSSSSPSLEKATDNLLNTPEFKYSFSSSLKM